jgi:hypothetical protein
MIDLSYFFNKFVLQLEPRNIVCTIRTFLIAFLSIPGAREYYEFISNENATRMGSTSWLIHAILAFEFIIFYRNISDSHFVEPFPQYVKNIWLLIFTILAVVLLGLIKRDFFRKRQQK